MFKMFVPFLIFFVYSIALAYTDSLFSVNGNTVIDFGRGSSIQGEGTAVPRNYLTCASDLRIEIKNFFLDTRFRIDAPNQAFVKNDPIAYRSYFNRRAIGFSDEHLSFRAGTFETFFAHGLTLSLREDLITDRAIMLDGMLLKIPGDFYEIKACAGQPLIPKSKQGSMGSGKNIVSQFFDNLQYRDLVWGMESSIDPLHWLHLPSVFKSAHTSMGVVLYQLGVDSCRMVKKATITTTTVTDTSGIPIKRVMISDTENVYLQNKTQILLPSFSLALGIGNVDINVDHTFFYDQKPVKPYITEEQDTFYLEHPPWRKSPNHATYSMAGLQFGDLSLTFEYKNYWYFRENTYSAVTIKEYLDPPKALYNHSWHFLTRHVLPNYMNDVIGYNIIGTLDVFDILFTGCFNYGGKHNQASYFSIDTENSSYYEIYSEAVKQVLTPLAIKIGVDYGRIEPDLKQNNYFTTGCKADLGPFGGHSFSLQGEYQWVRSSIFAEENNSSFLKLVPAPDIPANLVDTSSLYYMYDELSDDSKNIYNQDAFSYACILSYNNPLLSFNVTFEHQAKTDSLESEVVISRVKSVTKNNYLSFGASWRPFVNHEIHIEAGKFSGGKRCNTGTCVFIPPFNGFKLKWTGAF